MINVVIDVFFGSSQNQSGRGSWELQPDMSLAPVKAPFLKRLLVYLHSKFCELLTRQRPESQRVPVRAKRVDGNY